MRFPFKHVSVEDVTQWCTLRPVDMLHVWHTKVLALGLVNLQGRHEKHDGPQDKHVVSSELTIDDDGDEMQQSTVTPKKVALLYACSIEWLYTLDDLTIYTEVFRDVDVAKVGRGIFKMTFTVYLYGPPGG